ncbi:MAG TPA: hypothetical protein VEH83_03175 [Gemmatimonadales bacterium]|nr:hypothetical protein [Gemmatimonadales bacterium]
MSMHTRLGLVLMLCAAATVPLYAQSQQDSLEDRLEKAEEAIQRLQREIETEAQAKVQSRLQNRVEISGLVLVNGFYDGAAFNNADVPEWVAAAQDTTGRPNSRIGGALRQTRLGITVRPGRVLGGDLSADLQMDFFGSEDGVDATDRLVSPPRIRTANVRIDWPHLGLLVGQEKALVAPQSPVSFAAVGYPEFSGSGNLWYWIPQARLTAEAGTSFRVGIQAAALDPLWEPEAAYPSSAPDLGERSGRPAVEGRLYLDWGNDEKESTIGFGAHRGWIATAGTGTIASQALTADFRIVFGGIVTLSGSAFTGQVLNGLGDGGIAQDLGPLGQPVRTRGGWAQLDIRPTFAWEFGGGYGRDAPTDRDLLQSDGTYPAGARLRNVSYEGHLHWRPGGGLLLGAEFRRFETEFAAGVLKANQINGFMGLFF